MESPAVYGNPVAFAPVDWNFAPEATVRRGKSVEELGDAGWAKERERLAHLQHFQQLQRVAYAAYGVAPAGLPGRAPMATMPFHPGCPMPTAIMPAQGGPIAVTGAVPPPPWPVRWDPRAQGGQTAGEYDQRSHGHNVYYHPGSQDGHLDVRISEWKGKHCFYPGPEAKDGGIREGYGEFQEERRRDGRGSDGQRNSDAYGQRRRREFEEHDRKEKYKDGEISERRRRDDREYYEERRHRERDLKERDRYSNEYGDYEYDDARRDEAHDRYGNQYGDHDDARRVDLRYRDCYPARDADYYDSVDDKHYREKDRYGEEDHYRDRKYKDKYQDRRSEDEYERRERGYKDKDVYDPRSEENYAKRQRGQRDSELDERSSDRRGERSSRYKDAGEIRRDERSDRRRRDDDDDDDHDDGKAHYERRDSYGHENEWRPRRTEREAYEPRGAPSHRRPGDRYRDLRSLSVDEEYSEPRRKTHCEEWVEEQNKKLALRQMRSLDDPVLDGPGEEQERGERSGAAPKRGRKPVYVGSLDRNSFHRKTAPTSLGKSPFATTRRPNRGKRPDVVMSRNVLRFP